MATPKEKVFDIRERSFNFAVRIVKLCQYLDKNTEVNRRLVGQLLDAGTSIGANLEEARESKYWLRLLLATYDFENGVKGGIEELENEALELTKILAKIIINTKP